MLQIFVMAMATHPHVQAKARAEIEQVAGVDCLPSFEHRDRLPYIEALVKECLRWGVVAPLGAYIFLEVF